MLLLLLALLLPLLLPLALLLLVGVAQHCRQQPPCPAQASSAVSRPWAPVPAWAPCGQREQQRLLLARKGVGVGGQREGALSSQSPC